MDWKILFVLSVLLCFNCGFVFAESGTYGLAGFAWRRGSREHRLEVFEKQFKPIISAFGLEADVDGLEQCIREAEEGRTPTGSDCFNTIQTRVDYGFPRGDLAQPDFHIVRDGRTLNTRGTYLQLGDTVSFTPPKDTTPDQPVCGKDWITRGANLDTPPIILLDFSEYSTLRYKLEGKYNARYPCGDGRCNTVPVFSTQESAFPTALVTYPGEGDRQAFVMPLAGGKKNGSAGLLQCELYL